jgi:hypothetical protein
MIVGSFHDEAMRRFHLAAADVGLEVQLVDRCSGVAEALSKSRPLAILLRMDAQGAAEACAQARSHARFGEVAIVGAATQRSDLEFTELFLWGADDLVAVAAPHSVVKRLRALSAQQAARPGPAPAPARAQDALVAGADAAWRSVMGRALNNGGFVVRFEASAEGVARQCLAESVRVVVAADNLDGGGAMDALQKARESGSKTPWILVVPPKKMASAYADAATLGSVSVADGYAPPENVLFIVNELLAPRNVDQRASPRLLYGTTVAFRAAGREEDEIGFSYNVSAGGVFVRTLAPPEFGQDVWLEMWPPRSERRVRLEGVVAWRRAFGRGAGATVPPGFGVKLTEGLGKDMERWRSGCELFAEGLLGVRRVSSSTIAVVK